MKTSSSGAVIMSGAGLAAVRKRIQQAFEAAKGSVNELTEAFAVEMRVEVSEEGVGCVERSLEQKASVYLKVAERRFQHAVGRKHHHSAVNHISVPTETADELIRQALMVLGGKS